MAEIRPASSVRFESVVQVLVVGAGACGLTAALRAADGGAEVVVLERDASPSGSTSMSSGFVPAAGTRFQRAIAVEDTPLRFAGDIQAKAEGQADPALTRLATETIGPTLEWLADRHGIEWRVLEGFLYPGHTCARMHAVPEKTGVGLLARLLAAVENAGVPVVTDARVETLYTEGDRIAGVGVMRPDGHSETIACKALILASSGFAGNADLVATHIPRMARAPVYAHPGNRGEALLWGEALGARTGCLAACQGHGSLSSPHGILITWALMMQGGIQVNREGHRFSNEHRGYSEQSLDVLAQPGAIAWAVFDADLYTMAQDFPDFREAVAAGAIMSGDDVDGLASALRVPATALGDTLTGIERMRGGAANDPFGRAFEGERSFRAPFFAVKVTGALFHTQGGLMIDATARVLRKTGGAFPNLFAGGGAACGVSGPALSGYLSGNGLLTALAFGSIAGNSAIRFK